MLMEQIEAQLLGPPVAVRGARTCGLAEWALRFGLIAIHGISIFWNEGDGRNSLAEGALARIEVLYADDSARQRWSYFVFDIGGNKYRLIAAVHFNRQMVFIRLPTKT